MTLRLRGHLRAASSLRASADLRVRPGTAGGQTPLPRWIGGKGFSFSNTFGFIDTWSAGRNEVVTDQTLTDLAAAGCSFVRIHTQATFLYDAADHAMRLARLDEVFLLVDRVLAAGMKVIVNHRPPIEGQTIDAGAVVDDYETEGPNWLLDLAVLDAWAERLLPYDQRVAFEEFNEVETDIDFITAMKVARVERFRAINQYTTVIVGGDEYGNAYGLASLDPQAFAHLGNVIFKFFFYESGVFKDAGVDGLFKHVSGLSYPVVPSEKDAVVAAAFAGIDGDSGISDKQAAKDALSYFDPGTEQWVGFLDYWFDGILDLGWKQSVLDVVSNWADLNDIEPATHVICIEHGTSTTGATSKLSQVAFLLDDRVEMELRGIRMQGVWNYDAAPYSIGLDPDLLLALGFTPTDAFEAETTALLAELANPLSAYAQQVINAAHRQLMEADVWDSLDLWLFMRGEENTPDLPYINWRNYAEVGNVELGNATWEPAEDGRGYALSLDGSTPTVINTQHAMKSGSATAESFHIGVERISDDGKDIGRVDVLDQWFSSGARPGAFFAYAGNLGDLNVRAGPAEIIRHIMTNRDNADTFEIYDNGSLTTQVSQATDAGKLDDNGENKVIIGQSGFTIGGQLGLVHKGSDLDESQRHALTRVRYILNRAWPQAA